MSTVGQIEKRTQARVVALFHKRLNYDYLGDRTDRDNRNIELTLLRNWLVKQGVGDTLINRALHELNRVATDTSKHLYDRNKEVYDLLRYGVKVQPGAGENRVTVWLEAPDAGLPSAMFCRPLRAAWIIWSTVRERLSMKRSQNDTVAS